MIGILMLNTHFPRLPGDIGNASSFAQAVLYETVVTASVDKIVKKGQPESDLVDAFVKTGLRLVDQGATVIGTSCGFMASVQDEISARLPVPFLSSSLLLLAMLKSIYGEHAHIGILTFDSEKLGPCHFAEATHFQNSTISVTGLDPTSHWYRCIADDLADADPQRAKNDVLELAARCLEGSPQTTVILLECTNLSPWKGEIRTQTGLPVYDLVAALEWVNGSAL